MIKLGLTGSIGMGKSETARMFRAAGVPVFDADASVHGLFAKDGPAVGPLGEAFPGCVVDGAVDRQRLSALVAGKPEAWKKLESIVHPLVGQEQVKFLAEALAAGEPLVVLDIPLLFEGRGRSAVDKIVVVSAPADVQRKRVLERPGMTEEKLVEILSRQVPDEVKRAQADFVIPTDQGLDVARAHVERIVAELKGTMADA